MGTETLTTLNPKSSPEQVRTKPEIGWNFVDQLLEHHIYSEIAGILERARGLHPRWISATGERETSALPPKRVAYLTHTYRLRSRYDRLRGRRNAEQKGNGRAPRNSRTDSRALGRAWNPQSPPLQRQWTSTLRDSGAEPAD